MVEISNARYEELIRAETTLEIICRVWMTLPSYKAAEELGAVINSTAKGEVKTDAE